MGETEALGRLGRPEAPPAVRSILLGSQFVRVSVPNSILGVNRNRMPAKSKKAAATLAKALAEASRLRPPTASAWLACSST